MQNESIPDARGPVFCGVDTHADNKVMQHLLESEGFTRCGIIHVEDGTPRIAYQRLSLTQSQLG